MPRTVTRNICSCAKFYAHCVTTGTLCPLADSVGTMNWYYFYYETSSSTQTAASTTEYNLIAGYMNFGNFEWAPEYCSTSNICNNPDCGSPATTSGAGSSSQMYSLSTSSVKTNSGK